MLIDEGTTLRYRNVDLSKAKDFEQKARARIALGGKVKPVRRHKAGDTVDAAVSARGFALNAKVQRGIGAKGRSGPVGYTGKMTASPLQSSAFRKIAANSNKLLPRELVRALEAASKEVCSGKYQAVMAKYAKKYGPGRMQKQMNSPYGFFSSRIK
jgi:hypothetical protein